MGEESLQPQKQPPEFQVKVRTSLWGGREGGRERLPLLISFLRPVKEPEREGALHGWHGLPQKQQLLGHPSWGAQPLGLFGIRQRGFIARLAAGGVAKLKVGINFLRTTLLFSPSAKG